MADEPKDPPEEPTAGTEPENPPKEKTENDEAEYREVSPEVLRKIFDAHVEWLDSDGKRGERADLKNANLQETDLTKANLRGAFLREANLKEADLGDSVLRDAVLQDADLTGAKGLQAQQLAGANVSGTTLEKHIQKGFDDALAVVQEASKNARKLFLTMLLACAYSLLTIATTTDLGLILNSGSSELPIIRTQVPIVWFYLATPPFLLGVFIYFHIGMQRLWEGLGKLPAIFPDGRELDEKAYPWLLIGLARAHVPLLRQMDRKHFLWLQNGFAIALAWGVVPFTLYMFWARYIPRHDWDGTTLHLSLLILSALFTFFSYRHAVDILAGIPRKSSWTDKQPRTFRALSGELFRRMKLWPVCRGPRFFFGWARQYVNARLRMWRTWPALVATAAIVWFVYLSFAAITREESFTGSEPPFFRPYADLPFKDISEKLAGWTPGDTANVRGSNLVGANLRYAFLLGAFLPKAGLRWANLQGANLRGANLQGADLEGANLQGADLWEANLQGARFFTAHEGTPARVEGANLFGVSVLWEPRTLFEWLDRGAICVETERLGSPVRLGRVAKENTQAEMAPYLDAALNGDSTAIRRIEGLCGVVFR